MKFLQMLRWLHPRLISSLVFTALMSITPPSCKVWRSQSALCRSDKLTDRFIVPKSMPALKKKSACLADCMCRTTHATLDSSPPFLLDVGCGTRRRYHPPRPSYIPPHVFMASISHPAPISLKEQLYTRRNVGLNFIYFRYNFNSRILRNCKTN